MRRACSFPAPLNCRRGRETQRRNWALRSPTRPVSAHFFDSRPLGVSPPAPLQVLQLIVNYQDYQLEDLGRELDDRDAAEVWRLGVVDVPGRGGALVSLPRDAKRQRDESTVASHVIR